MFVALIAMTIVYKWRAIRGAFVAALASVARTDLSRCYGHLP